jgi:glycosyltransferase involved in cell wall biosynthesis
MTNRGDKTRRRRVVHLTLGLDVGGQEKLLVEFARHADRQRFALHFLVLGGRGPLAATIEDLSWPVTALGQPDGVRPGLIPRLARWLRRGRFDVLHTHDDKPLLYGGPAARLAQVGRLVHTQHHGPVPQISRRQAWLVQWAGRLADVFVCVSHDSARHMAGTGLPSGRIRTLWNGIDLSRFPFRGPSPAGPAVTVARLSPEKDIANLLRAVALVVRSTPAFRLEIAGAGPCHADLMNLASALQLGDCVRLLGEVGDIPALLARARLFILPSRTEGISLTLLEAMACGLPVVTTKVGGNPEVVLDGSTGLLVPPRDPNALARAIMQVWNNLELAHQMGRAARRRAESHFDIRRMVARYEDLYLDSTASKGTPADHGLGLLSNPAGGLAPAYGPVKANP